MFWVHVSGLRFRLRLVFRFLFVCLVSVSGFFWLRLVSFIFCCHAVSQHFIELLLGYSGLTGFCLACVFVNSFGFFWVLNEFCMCRWWSNFHTFPNTETQSKPPNLTVFVTDCWCLDTAWLVLRDGNGNCMVYTRSIQLADGHTVSNAPDLFRPPKLSGTGPG